jgi:DNA-binding FadR family transcriptional regulator
MPARDAAKPNPKPAPPGRNLHTHLARSIGQRIIGGEFAPGQVLPNEAEWGRIYGASRTAVREAVKALTAKGLLVSRPKIGSRVEPRGNWNLLDRDVLSWHGAAMERRTFLESTQEIRKLFEPGIAELAARKRTREQLKAIQAAYEGMRAAPSAEDMVAPDVQFHLSLLAAANNDLLAPIGIMIEHTLGALFDFTTRRNPKLASALPLHEAILDAVARRDAGAARKAAIELLEDTDRVISAARRLPGRRGTPRAG